MFKRGLVFCLALVLVTSAKAQVNITFNPPGGSFPAATGVDVEVFLTNTSGANKEVRFVQLDFTASTAGLLSGATYPANPAGATVPFWDFSSITTCSTTPSTCGQNHFIEAIPATPRPGVGSIAWKGLTQDESLQITLTNNVARRIGVIHLQPAASPTPYTLNAINAAGVGPDAGSEIRWGFGVIAGDDLTKVRSGSVPALTGGTGSYTFTGGTCGGPDVTLVSADRGNNAALSQIRRNKIIITFSGAVPAAPPVAADFTVRKLLAGNTFGPNIAAQFTYTVNGSTLIVQDTAVSPTPAALENGSWYSIHSMGTWSCVADFCLDFRVRHGDADGNGLVNFADLANANTSVGQPQNDANRWRNIDANAVINFADLAAANTFIGNPPTAKPAGHLAVCVP